MPMGPGTYGSKVGRPKKKLTKKAGSKSLQKKMKEKYGKKKGG